jgi:para-nitrobenzyl esterase
MSAANEFPAHHDGALAAAAPEAETRSGRVRGFWRETSAVFLGIPFAAAPVGEHRFLAPAPVAPWTGVREARAYGPTPQRRDAVEVTTIPEPSVAGDEILSVNVYTPLVPGSPPDAANPGLPVLVWIHGGGYRAGSPASPWYDGAAFNRDGVVVVALSYRLGFEGFGWIDGAPLNRGILDQIAALEWVRDNIGAFGGDPARVTLGGQSAGASSALALSTSPRAAGLFRAVIAQSAPVYGMRPADAEAIGRRFAAALGVAPDLSGWRAVAVEAILDAEPGAQLSGDGILHPTMALPMLARAAHDPGADITGIPFAPVVDGEVVVDLVPAIGGGRGARLPLLLGSTTHEFTFPSAEEPDEVEAALAGAGVTPGAIARFRSAVAAIGGTFARGQLSSAVLFRVPVVRWAAARLAAGAGQRTWLYDFAFRAPATGLAGHCIDLPFVWDLLDAVQVRESVGTDLPHPLAATMHAEWVEFVSTGSVSWPAVTEHLAGAMRFDAPWAYDPDAYAFEAELAGA